MTMPTEYAAWRILEHTKQPSLAKRDSGNAVVVEIAQRGSPPRLTPVKTGRLDWRTIERTVDQPHSLEALIEELGKLNQPAGALVRVLLEAFCFRGPPSPGSHRGTSCQSLSFRLSGHKPPHSGPRWRRLD